MRKMAPGGVVSHQTFLSNGHFRKFEPQFRTEFENILISCLVWLVSASSEIHCTIHTEFPSPHVERSYYSNFETTGSPRHGMARPLSPTKSWPPRSRHCPLPQKQAFLAVIAPQSISILLFCAGLRGGENSPNSNSYSYSRIFGESRFNSD
jgi:hypothetical protein